jgi:hypothetical protein
MIPNFRVCIDKVTVVGDIIFVTKHDFFSTPKPKTTAENKVEVYDRTTCL